jgi:hypothetical protein
MEILLHKNQFPTGSRNSIQFVWDFGKLKIRTYAQHITVSDGDIYERDGAHFITPRSLNRFDKPAEIEIPTTVLEQMDQLNINLKNSRESIGHVDHKTGKIFLSLNADGQILAKHGCKTAISDVEIIENKNAINIEALGLAVQYIEVPQNVEAAYTKAKNIKIMEKCSLTSAGKSLLTGKEYFKFNNDIPASSWDCIEDFFEDFGSGSGRTGELKGWLTSTPEKVENALGIKHRAGKRGHDDIKQFEEAITLIKNNQ